jgi:hypothetical protein
MKGETMRISWRKWSFFTAAVLLGCGIVVAQGTGTASSSVENGCPAKFKIVAPANMAVITGKSGVMLKGAACSGEDVWVFDYDPADHKLYRDNDDALSVNGGQWSFKDAPIGDHGNSDNGTVYTIIAVQANQICSHAIGSKKPVAGDVTFSRLLPSSCPDIIGALDVSRVAVVKNE